jgi:hypothetical protein
LGLLLPATKSQEDFLFLLLLLFPDDVDVLGVSADDKASLLFFVFDFAV